MDVTNLSSITRGSNARKKILFALLFGALVLVGDRINFSTILGAPNQYFTLFQFFGPVAGGFLGPLVGVVSVLLAEVVSFVLNAKETSALNLLRLTPMLFGAYYFGVASKKNYAAFVPLACMALFILHPVGSQVWYYSLYWLIPAAAALFPSRLFLRSLGATFTAHAIGSTIFLYTIPTAPSLWLTLIPIVAYERLMFAGGIALSYLALNTLLDKLLSEESHKLIKIDPRYVVTRASLRL
ncbi:MAG: hypothetical protein AB1468_02425 [Candidatus Micrarchaeota archaeon]